MVAVEGAFHGRTAAAAAVTSGHESWYGFPSAPFATTFVPFDDASALARADSVYVLDNPMLPVAEIDALLAGIDPSYVQHCGNLDDEACPGG